MSHSKVIGAVGLVLVSGAIAVGVAVLRGQDLDRAAQWVTVVGFFISTVLGVSGLVLGWLTWRQTSKAMAVSYPAGQLVDSVTVGHDHGERVAEFTAGLRRMHEEAGKPSLRQMSSEVHYSPTALSRALQGVGRLPSLELTLALVRVCGGDQQAWSERWHKERARIAAHTPSRGHGLGAG